MNVTAAAGLDPELAWNLQIYNSSNPTKTIYSVALKKVRSRERTVCKVSEMTCKLVSPKQTEVHTQRVEVNTAIRYMHILGKTKSQSKAHMYRCRVGTLL